MFTRQCVDAGDVHSVSCLSGRKKMIVVTGATGQLGGRIVEQLLDLGPADRIVATTRTPEKATDLTARGVEVRHGDFADPATLASAFQGVSQLLIVSSNAQASGGDPLAQHRAAIDAARTAGAARIVYTRHMGAGASSAFPPMRTHCATEAMLTESGVPWAALRNGFYASTVPRLVGDAPASGVLSAPQDGPVSWTTHDDLARAAACVLTEEGRFEGPTPPLTASKALDLADVAALLAELHGRPVERRVVTDEDQRREMEKSGVPARAIDMTLGLYEAMRAGEFATVDPTLATLLGRSPETMRDVLTGEPGG